MELTSTKTKTFTEESGRTTKRMGKGSTSIQKVETFTKGSGNMAIKRDKVVYILRMGISTMGCFRITIHSSKWGSLKTTKAIRVKGIM